MKLSGRLPMLGHYSVLAASMFCTIAAEGKPYDMVQLRSEYQVSDSTVSRNVSYLDKLLPRGGKRTGLGLVEIEDHQTDRRLKVIKLTNRGSTVVQTIERIMAQ